MSFKSVTDRTGIENSNSLVESFILLKYSYYLFMFMIKVHLLACGIVKSPS